MTGWGPAPAGFLSCLPNSGAAARLTSIYPSTKGMGNWRKKRTVPAAKLSVLPQRLQSPSRRAGMSPDRPLDRRLFSSSGVVQ